MPTTTTRLITTTALMTLAACGGSNSLTQTGSQAMTRGPDGSGLVVAQTSQGRVAFLPNDLKQPMASLELEGFPARVATAQGRAFVSLQQKRQIAVIESSSKPTVVGTIDVGAEPFGLVASPDGATLYVALQQEGRVVEVDPASLAIVRSIPVNLNQPRWLAIHPSGRTLYVTSALDTRVAVITVATGSARTIAGPTLVGRNFNDGTTLNPTARVTGDPAVTPNGEQLLVPTFVVDNTTVVHEADDAPNPDQPAPPPFDGGGGYNSGGRFIPAVTVIPLDSDGVPIPQQVPQVFNVSAFTFESKAGYPSSVVPLEDSKHALVLFEGAAGGAIVDLDPNSNSGVGKPEVLVGDAAIAPPGRFGGSSIEGISFTQTVGFDTGAGARALVLGSDNKAYIYSFLTRTVSELPVDTLEKSLNPGSDGRLFGGSPDVISTGPVSTQAARVVGDDLRSEDIIRGEFLFYAANDSRMATPGAGLSCATCHFDSRNDGLTWAFSRGVRQTPSLAGKVSLQEPVRWDGLRATVATDALATSQGLMGGQGMQEKDAAQIAAFVDWTPDVDVALRAGNSEAVARGRAIFNRPEVGCGTCHAGARYTDKQRYKLYGLEAQTRSLVSVSASAPYFHDGSAPTLEAVLDRARDGSMGNTGSLNTEEMADLATYLRSL